MLFRWFTLNLKKTRESWIKFLFQVFLQLFIFNSQWKQLVCFRLRQALKIFINRTRVKQLLNNTKGDRRDTDLSLSLLNSSESVNPDKSIKLLLIELYLMPGSLKLCYLWPERRRDPHYWFSPVMFQENCYILTRTHAITRP